MTASTKMSTTDLLGELISFDTTSRNSNLECIGFIDAHLSALGARTTLVHDETGTKANLYATLGPQQLGGGVALSGHSDVVPVDGQPWTSDPFAMTRRDDKLFGRGTSDMKGFIAAALRVASKVEARRLKRPLHFVFSYDEEVGCIGVPRLLDWLADQPIRPAACVVGEPTSMRVMRGHKGKLAMRCHVHGHESHSSLTHLGVNAVEMAAEMIVKLRQMGRRHREEGPFDHEYDPPHTTVHTGVVSGGTQLNIVPRECAFDFEFRHLPADDPHDLLGELKHFTETELLPSMQSVQPTTGVDFKVQSEAPGLDESDAAPIAVAARAVTGDNRSGKVPYGTEAGHFKKRGIDAIICGPGSIEQAHKPDEFVEVAQLGKCDEFLEKLVERWCC